MRLDEAVDLVEGSGTVEALKASLQAITEAYGFASFGFVDVGTPGSANPLWLTTSDPQWVEDYRGNDFVSFDPAVAMTRRSNKPFAWSDLPAPKRLGKWKPKAQLIMEAARDFGFRDGLVVPFHFVDRLGQIHTVCCGFYWKDRRALFSRLPPHVQTELHVIMIYWSQRLLALTSRSAGERGAKLAAEGRDGSALSDRERSVLEWAARGKTVPETASILSISTHTVETHVRSAIAKLAASNKVHAAAKAIKAGLIDL